MSKKEVPNHSWAVYRSGRDGTRHVVPMTTDLKVKPPHIVSRDCPCGPTEDETDDTLLVHHTSH